MVQEGIRLGNVKNTAADTLVSGYSERPDLAHPRGHIPGSQASHAGHEQHAVIVGTATHHIHTAHRDHDAAIGHDKHAGHPVDMFR